jgi:O-antigen/teichoic acid export membrane protein
MTVNTVSLLGATIATNLLGLVFWGAAARLADPEAVGTASAVVAALLVLSTIAQLNLGAIYLRFLPLAGKRTRAFIARGYCVVALLGVVAGTAYVLSGLGDDLLHSSWIRIGFIVSVVLFAVFALQDAVLTSLRITWWVPIENVTFAAFKLALLPVLVSWPAGAGIVAAWVIPLAVAIVVINTLLFAKVLRGGGRTAAFEAPERPDQIPTRRRLLSFVGAEYAGNLCGLVTMQVMPLLVIWRLGAVQNAYFTVPWLIWLGIAVLLANVSSTFVVEVVTKPQRAAHALRQGLRLWGVVVLAAVLVCGLMAPFLLRAAGAGYAGHATELVRLIGLSAPFLAFTYLYGAFAWLEQRVWRLATIQVVSGALIVGLTIVLLPRFGVAGAGWANLAVQAASAAVMAPAVMSRLSSWRSSEHLPAGRLA